jgi:hypothetical protein
MPESEDDPAPLEPCAFCGAFTALQLGGRPVCEVCYQQRGSCCSEQPDEAAEVPEKQAEES